MSPTVYRKLAQAPRVVESRLLPSLERSLVASLASLILVIVTFHIVSRLVGHSYRWTEEAARLATIWATFLSVPLFVRNESLIAIRLGQESLPDRAVATFRLLSNLAVLVVMAAILWLSLPQAIADFERISPGLEWPMGLFLLPVSVMASLSIVHALPHVIRYAGSVFANRDVRVPAGESTPDSGAI